MVASKKRIGRPPVKEEGTTVGIRMNDELIGWLDQMATMWRITRSASARKVLYTGRDALMNEAPGPTRFLLLASRYDQLSPENRLHADVILKILEKEIAQLLSSQSSAS